MPVTEIATAPAPRRDPARVAEIRDVAQKFEAAFLAQVLDLAGVAKNPESFGGGAGEDAFRTHLLAEHARALTEAGGVGLAGHVFEALLAREGLTE
jgi:hypothetical protein